MLEMGLSAKFLLIFLATQVLASELFKEDESPCSQSDSVIIKETTVYLDVGSTLFRWGALTWIDREILLHNLMTIKYIAKSEEAQLARIFCGNRARFLETIHSYAKSFAWLLEDLGIPEDEQVPAESIMESLILSYIEGAMLPHLTALRRAVTELDVPDEISGIKPLHFCDRIEGMHSDTALDLEQSNIVVGNLRRKRRKPSQFFELHSNCPEVQMGVEFKKKRKYGLFVVI